MEGHGVTPGLEVDRVPVRVVRLGRGDPGESSVCQVVVAEERLRVGNSTTTRVACAYTDVSGMTLRGPEWGVAGRVLWMTWEGRLSCLGCTDIGAAEAGTLASSVVRYSGMAWPW